jgi:hypothetical protein
MNVKFTITREELVNILLNKMSGDGDMHHELLEDLEFSLLVDDPFKASWDEDVISLSGERLI